METSKAQVLKGDDGYRSGCQRRNCSVLFILGRLLAGCWSFKQNYTYQYSSILFSTYCIYPLGETQWLHSGLYSFIIIPRQLFI